MSMYVPTSLFFGLCTVLFILMIISFKLNGIFGIITSFLSAFISFYLSQIVINEQLIENIGGIDSTGNVIQGVTIIQIPALSYIFTFIAIVMVGLTIYQTWLTIQENNTKIIEIDF